MRTGCIVVLLCVVAWFLIARSYVLRETLEAAPPVSPDMNARVGKLESKVKGIESDLTSLSSQFKQQQDEINQAQAQVNAAANQISGVSS
jgi:peptidoglycan hydrolase CwlO-like protein